VQDVTLTRTYNFYHSPFPEEVKLVLTPLQKLLMRLRDIVVRDGYESPLLNESMFLANYMLTCFNAENTPLMKVLMSVEFLLTKLEEWENTYASKRLNSVESEINTLKQIVIRLRKIQIMSWRNLLNWKRDKFVKEDFENYVRLAHTLERQVFDSKLYKRLGKGEMSVEMKMFELLDLFMRDSTLGVFASRLRLVTFLNDHF
jgi:midasin (ATPase involved in ribosome maturation)